jgi:Domain of unknown function (DUF4136)
MTNRRSGAFCVAFVLCVAGLVFAAKIKSDFDKTANFAGYKTYAWGNNLEPQRPGASLVILGATNYELHNRGLEMVDVDRADLIIRYEAAGDTDVNFSVSQDPTYANVGGVPLPGTTMWTWGFGGPSGARFIHKGSLVIDVFDKQQHKLIWSAMAKANLSSSPNKAITEVGKIISQMFQQYPVKGRT